MRVLAWLFWLVVFFFLFWVALKNADPVTLRLTADTALNAPLVIVILVSFAFGVVLGMVTASPKLFRQSREIKRLKRAGASVAGDLPGAGEPPNPPDVPSLRS